MIAGAPKPLAVVIDDDAHAAEALALTLRDWGADVIAGASAQAVLAQVESRAAAITWVITDFDLGGEDGVSGAAPLLARAPHARVLVLSGAVAGKAGQAAAKAGFDVMDKPATAAAITGWLERVQKSA